MDLERGVPTITDVEDADILCVYKQVSESCRYIQETVVQ